MHQMRILVSVLCLVSLAARGESNWAAGVREGGNGFYIAAPDQSFHLNLLGYGQFLGHALSHDYRRGDRADHTVGMSVRRARLSTLATVHRNFEFLVELGTPTQRPFPPGVTAFRLPPGATATPTTPTTPATTATALPDPQSLGLAHSLGTSDLGLVEARLTAPIFSDWLSLRVGKFIGPFSAENSKHPRNLDTIERSTVVNTMHTIPALDTQIGIMLFGRILNNVVNYYFAAFNGNSDSLTSANDNNATKSFQVRIVFQPHRNVVFGFGWETDQMPTRLISMIDHAWAPVVTAAVLGTRHGLSFDWDLTVDWFSWRMETQYYTFPDSTGNNYMRYLYGNYLQLGFQVAGDQTKGLQLIGRHEWARAQVNGSRDLHSVLLGFNIFINSNMKNTVNYIAEIPTHAAGSGAYSTTNIKHVLLNQLQVKF